MENNMYETNEFIDKTTAEDTNTNETMYEATEETGAEETNKKGFFKKIIEKMNFFKSHAKMSDDTIPHPGFENSSINYMFGRLGASAKSFFGKINNFGNNCADKCGAVGGVGRFIVKAICFAGSIIFIGVSIYLTVKIIPAIVKTAAVVFGTVLVVEFICSMLNVAFGTEKAK